MHLVNFDGQMKETPVFGEVSKKIANLNNNHAIKQF